MTTRLFECGSCAAFGKITLKNDDLTSTDITCCPVCGADISEPEDYETEPQES